MLLFVKQGLIIITIITLNLKFSESETSQWILKKLRPFTVCETKMKQLFMWFYPNCNL
jgi:hypothetical protein